MRLTLKLHKQTLFLKRIYSDKIFVHRDKNDNTAASKFAFSSENLAKADQIIAKYPTQYKKSAIIPLLDLGQRQHGYTSLSVMNEVARILDIPEMRVYEVATFYTMFNRDKVGKHVIQVCTTTPCQLCGSDSIIETIKKHLKIEVGETTKDNMFTLQEVECAGACVNAPVICIDDNYYEDLTPKSTISVLETLKKGKMPKVGPQSKRHGAEPIDGLTSLKKKPYGPGFLVRKDL